MITLKNFISLYAYGKDFTFDALDSIQVRDFDTTAHFRVSEGGIPTLGGDLIPGLTTKEAVLNKSVRFFDVDYDGIIEVYI